jgi:hypothetical protein
MSHNPRARRVAGLSVLRAVLNKDAEPRSAPQPPEAEKCM